MSDFPINTRYTFSELLGIPAEASGMKITASTVANVKGVWAEILASTAQDIHAIMVVVDKRQTEGHLLDIGIGAAGSEVVIMENLMSGDNKSLGGSTKFFIPFYIAKGTRVSARSQHHTNANAFVQILGFAGTFETDGAGSRTTTFGAVTATSNGTRVDPGATFGVFSAWVEFSASVPDDIRYLAIMAALPQESVQGDSRGALEIGVGGAGSEERIIRNYLTAAAGPERSSPCTGAIPVDIPAGTRLSVRAISNSGASPQRAKDVILLGIT